MKYPVTHDHVAVRYYTESCSSLCSILPAFLCLSTSLESQNQKSGILAVSSFHVARSVLFEITNVYVNEKKSSFGSKIAPYGIASELQT